MKKTIWQNRWFLLPFTFFILVCIILLLLFSKPELHILINRANSPFFDRFFKYATWLGDGVMIFVVAVFLLFVRYRYFFAFLSGSLLAAGVVNLIKKVLLPGVYRPMKYFSMYETYNLHFVEGVKVHSINSFPSGHTAVAFSVFLMLALLVRGNPVKLLFFFTAAFVSYSRIYLSQHFMIDLTAGALISVPLMLISFQYMQNREAPWLDKHLFMKKFVTHA